MRKFEKKINELGLQKGALSKNLNDLVRNFELAEDELKNLKIELKAAEKEEDNEEEIDNLISKIEETESQLDESDDYLVKKVISHHKNGDTYAIRIQKMKQAREAKLASKNSIVQSQPEPQTKPVETPKNEPIVTNNTELKAEPVSTGTPREPKKEEDKEEKGTNWLLWGVLGVAGIFVGINLFKNKR